MQNLRIFCFFIVFSIMNTTLSFATEQTDNIASSPTKTTAKVKPAEAWYRTGAPLSGKGKLWEQGASVEELNRRRTPTSAIAQSNTSVSVKNNKTSNKQLKNINEYERSLTDKPMSIGNAKIHSDSSVDESTWRPGFTEPIKIDEPVLNSQRNVVGAYASMVEEDNFSMSAGPELHIQEEQETLLDSDGPPQSSELGMGMKLRWGF